MAMTTGLQCASFSALQHAHLQKLASAFVQLGMLSACHICPRSSQVVGNLLPCKLPINNTFVNEAGSQWEKPLRIHLRRNSGFCPCHGIQDCLKVTEPKDHPGLKPRRADFGLLELRTSGSCLHLQGVMSFGTYGWDTGRLIFLSHGVGRGI